MAVGGPWSFWVGIHSVLGSVGSVFLFCMSSLSAEEKKKPSLEDNPFPEAWNMKTKTQFETARNELVRFVPECVARVPVSLWGSGGCGCVRSTLRLRSQPFATVRNRSQLFATVHNRPLEGRMAVPMVSSAKGVIFGGFKRRVASFRVAGVALRDIHTCFVTCRKSFCVAGAILLRRFRKMSCSFRGRRSTLDVPVVILRGRRSSQGCVKWRQANCVAGVAFCEM